MEKSQPKPKVKVYVPRQPIPKGTGRKGKDLIIMDNHVILDLETIGNLKDPMVFLYYHGGNDKIFRDPLSLLTFLLL